MWEFLRKFGMEYCDMPTMLWNVAFMLRFLALNIDRRNDKGIPTIFYVTTLVTGLSYVYVYVVSVFWFVLIRCPETGDRLNAILVLALGTAAGICATKLVYVYFYQHTVRGLIDGYLACDAMVLPGSRFSDNLANTLRSVKKRALIAWVVLSFNGIYYIGEALIRPGRHMPEDCFIFYGLEPILDSPNFEIAFTLNVLALIFVCYLASNITAFFIIITGYIEAQMLALTVELKLLWNDAQTHYNCNIQSDIESDRIDDNASKENLLNEYVKQRLVDIAKFHMRNIALFRDVEKVFRGAIAGEFMFLMISLIGVLLVGLENAYIQLPFTLVMIGMDCLLGQRVMDASADFTEALYDCKWENFDTSNRKIVLLMLQNAQKGMALSAGGITTLSYTCFMSIIKSIYSVFTALRSTV